MKIKTKKLRFFYHYNRKEKGLTLHYKGRCYPIKDIVCKVPCESKWQKVQPNLIMRGYCEGIFINEVGLATIV